MKILNIPLSEVLDCFIIFGSETRKPDKTNKIICCSLVETNTVFKKAIGVIAKIAERILFFNAVK